MAKLYQGNSGHCVSYPEAEYRQSRPQDAAMPRPMYQKAEPPPKIPGLGALAELLPGRFLDIETEDIILLLILYLMYRESGDSSLLIIMGALFLL